jgi:hypothetical protein
MKSVYKSARAWIILGWILIVGLYMRFEAYPVWFTGTVSGYRGIFPDHLLARESWSLILIDNAPAGYAHTIISMDDEGPAPILEVTSRMHLRVSLFQMIQNIQIRSEIKLDMDYNPQEFMIAVHAGDFSMRIHGEHKGDRIFAVTTASGTTSSTKHFQLPRDAILYSPVYELAIQQLRPGRSLAIRTLDPLTLQTSTMLLTAGSREIIMVGAQPRRAMPVETSWQGLAFRIWVDEDGMMLRQETPLGWVMETSTPEEALQSISESNPAPPLLRNMAGMPFLLNLIGTNTP